MFHNKKGDLAISTNAIVILIIAVIMLGLIIGFVTRGFGAVEDRFFGQIESSTPEPVRASSGNPVTLSSTTVIARQGEQFGLKVSVFNSDASPKTSFAPSISCPEGVLAADSVKANAKTIAPNEAETYTVIAEADATAPAGQSLCSVTAGTENADLIIEVRD